MRDMGYPFLGELTFEILNIPLKLIRVYPEEIEVVGAFYFLRIQGRKDKPLYAFKPLA